MPSIAKRLSLLEECSRRNFPICERIRNCLICLFSGAWPSTSYLLFSPGPFVLLWIQIHHLTPELVLHIAVFVHFCETFLGIEPHFELFWSLYTLVPQPSSGKIDSIGCASLQLASEMIGKYLEWTRIHVDPEWRSKWFYINNPTPTLPKFFANCSPVIERSRSVQRDLVCSPSYR